MLDLEIAKNALKNEAATLVIVKDGKVLFRTSEPGMRGLLQAIEALKHKIRGASIADSVIGRAAALLLAYSKVKEAYAVLLSEEGLKVLKANSINYEFEKTVPWILNRSQTDLCPFEKLSMDIESSAEAYEKLKKFEESMSR